MSSPTRATPRRSCTGIARRQHGKASPELRLLRPIHVAYSLGGAPPRFKLPALAAINASARVTIFFMSICPAVDSNTLTYLLDVFAVDDYEPALDASKVKGERLAMVWCYRFGSCSPWVPPTARTESLRIPNLEKRERHDRWTRYHLQNQDLTTPQHLLHARVDELLPFHKKRNDCMVVAETEFADLQTLLSVDADMRKRLQPHTSVRILRPSEFWNSLEITREPDIVLGPARDNPNYGKAWLAFPTRPQG